MNDDPKDLLLGPYATRVTERSAVVLWLPHAGAASPGRLFYRPAPGAALREAPTRPIAFPPGPETLRAADVTGLAPHAPIEYELEIGGERVFGSFSTPPPTGARTPFRFVMYGDNRSGPERHREVLEGARRDLPYVFITNTGDLTANAASWRQWRSEFFGPGRELFRRTAVWPVRGNHEVDAILLRAFFDLPGPECYYSVDVGNLHYVVLDSELLDFDHDPAAHARMCEWLERDLSATHADWIISASHVPIFNIGGDGAAWGRADVLDILERHGGDIHISSHSHLYERFRPIGPAGGKPIIHLVSGGGGGPAYELRPSPILAKNYSGLHYCFFEADGLRLDMTVKAPDGTVVDRLTLEKRDGRFAPDLMRDALTTAEAADLAYVESVRLRVDYLETPAPGRECRVALRAHERLPAEAWVRLESAADGGWAVPPSEFEAGRQPFELAVRAPDNLEVRSGFVRPPLRLRRTVVLRGIAYAGGDVAPSLTEASIRRFIPDPVRVPVPRAPAGWCVDGRLEKWRAIPPVSRAGGPPSRAVRLAWDESGLYGAFWDAAPPGAPRGEYLEFYVESDFGRALSCHRTPWASSFRFSPDRAAGPGPANASSGYGPLRHRPREIAARWDFVDGAAAVEFRIPAVALGPDPLAPGRVLGLHYRLWAGNTMLEEYLDTEGKSAVWMTPLYWGAVRLA